MNNNSTYHLGIALTSGSRVPLDRHPRLEDALPTWGSSGTQLRPLLDSQGRTVALVHSEAGPVVVGELSALEVARRYAVSHSEHAEIVAHLASLDDEVSAREEIESGSGGARRQSS